MALIPVRASDLRQWVYCPRVVYYTATMPGWRPTTTGMAQGTAAHRQQSSLERRRSLRFAGLENAEREFRPRLSSEGLGLTGIPDLLVVTQTETIPVEFKATQHRPGPGTLLQLAAYALLVDETPRSRVRRAFVRNVPSLETFELPIGGRERAAVLEALAAVRAMLTDDSYPAPTAVRARCAPCEFAALCPDVWDRGIDAATD